MTSQLNAIVRNAPGQYTVHLELLGTSRRLSFDFTVDTAQGIERVNWSDDFAAHMGQNLGPTSPLLEAVLQFHRAGKIELP